MPSQWWVVCLCADWCGVCREYRPVFEALAARHPGVRFEWLDVEDEADLLGDFDAETFPTLLVGPGLRGTLLGRCCRRRECWSACWRIFWARPAPRWQPTPPRPALWMRIQASFPASALPDGRIAE